MRAIANGIGYTGGLLFLATCWTIIRRDGTRRYFTDHDQDLIIGGVKYLASGYSRSAIAFTDSFEASTVELSGLFNTPIFEQAELFSGSYNYARVVISLVDYTDLSAGLFDIYTGVLGEVLANPSGGFSVELQGYKSLLGYAAPNVYQPTCRADLGDTKCRVPIFPPILERDQDVTSGQWYWYTLSGSLIYEVIGGGRTRGSLTGVSPGTTVGATHTDGTARFKAYASLSHSATVTAVRSTRSIDFSVSHAVPAGWLDRGALRWTSGAYSGTVWEIQSWSGSTASLYLPLSSAPAVGDTAILTPGCNKTLEDCINKFKIAGSLSLDGGNVLNYRGEPYLPGRDDLKRFGGL